MFDIQFQIPGPILGWMRPAQGRNKKTGKKFRFDPDVQVAYKKQIAWTCFTEMRRLGLGAIKEGPVALGVYAYFPYPGTGKDYIDYKCSKPDLDNIIKNVKDSLNGVAYKDDSQVAVYLEPYKVFSPDAGEHGFLVIRVVDLNGRPAATVPGHAREDGPASEGRTRQDNQKGTGGGVAS